MPLGSLTTVPNPEPETCTWRVYALSKLADMVVKPAGTSKVQVGSVTSWQGPPDHPVNDESGEGDAVRVISVPAGKTSLQSDPHEMPGGSLTTEPVPDPVRDTLTNPLSGNGQASFFVRVAIAGVAVEGAGGNVGTGIM
jgi:hypothetical protein